MRVDEDADEDDERLDEDEDEKEDEIDEVDADDGDLVKLRRLDDDSDGERVGSEAPASLYRPSLLRKSYTRCSTRTCMNIRICPTYHVQRLDSQVCQLMSKCQHLSNRRHACFEQYMK